MHEKVIAFFRTWDPEKLLVMGAPEHEYDGEAHKLVKRLESCVSSEDVARCLAEIMYRGFETGRSSTGESWEIEPKQRYWTADRCLAPAKKLWEILR